MAVTIKILPDDLINRIAAGEVVERPASVVKELVENALDAGARDITIEVRGGGRGLLRVTDDGTGMSREDALLALERHATSKIATGDDLFSIRTLGFRGEALAAIAGVSKIELVTRRADAEKATRVVADGGTVRQVQDVDAPPGTSIAVRDLFFNTPARLKFMKSSAVETAHIIDLVTRLALSRDDLGIRLIRGTETLVSATKGRAPRDRLGELLGSNLVRHLYPFRGRRPRMSVEGFASSPELTRSAGSGIHAFINRRFTKDRVIVKAIRDAYRGIIPKGRHPVIVLFLELDPHEVDVNVHPGKIEVRFSRPRSISDLIVRSIRAALHRRPWEMSGSEAAYHMPPFVPDDVREFLDGAPLKADPDDAPPAAVEDTPPPVEARQTSQEASDDEDQALERRRLVALEPPPVTDEDLKRLESLEKEWDTIPEPVEWSGWTGTRRDNQVKPQIAAHNHVKTKDKNSTQTSADCAGNREPRASWGASPIPRVPGEADLADGEAAAHPPPSAESASRTESAKAEATTASAASAAPPASETRGTPDSPLLPGLDVHNFSRMRIIGQYADCFILCQDGEELVLLDQHAAHERVTFERLRQAYEGIGRHSQGFLTPIRVEVEPREVEILKAYLEDLRHMGLDLEVIGTNRLLVKAIPSVLVGEDPADLLHELAADLAGDGATGPLGDRIYLLLATMACHGSVRANRPMSVPEIEALMKQLDGTDFNFACPHGRPLVIRWTRREVEKLFKRT